jgi:hypothetical protein
MSANSVRSLFQKAIASTLSANVGREPDGPGPDSLGRYFASLAQLEAASAESFSLLRDELAAIGAPHRLLRAVSRAAHDEIGHARLCSMLARQNGAAPLPAAALLVRPRALREMAVDNALEAMVRERYAAQLVATFRKCQGDALLRTALRAIATDEGRHAELLFAVSAWACDQLDPATRQKVAALRRRFLSGPSAEARPETEASLAG